MPLQRRTHITLLLPAPTTFPQYLLVDQVLTDMISICGGATHTTDIPPVVRGRWIDVALATKHDELMLIFGDTLAPSSSPNLLLFLDNLKRRTQRDFSQDIIWMTVHEVHRLDTDDYVT